MEALPLQRQPAFRLGGRLGTIIVVGILAAAIAAVAWYVDQPTAGGYTRVTTTGGGTPPQAGAVPPDFQATTIDGKSVRLSDLRGQPVWLTFGASWCADCRAEAPDLETAYQQSKAAGLVIVGVFVQEDDQAVRDYAGRVGMTFPMISDPSWTIADAYHILGLPTHFFIGRDGVIREVRLGRLPPEEMQRLVATLMP
jgi:peroxiredoxin